jgi:hypothetical protein
LARDIWLCGLSALHAATRFSEFDASPIFSYDKIEYLRLSRGGAEWSLGSTFRAENAMLLLYTGPGFVYVGASFKDAIIAQLSQ